MNDPFKSALLNAHGTVVTHGKRRYKLDCRTSTHRAFGTEEFTCDAEHRNPETPEEAEYCIIDLWRSESTLSAILLEKFAKRGGWENEVAV